MSLTEKVRPGTGGGVALKLFSQYPAGDLQKEYWSQCPTWVGGWANVAERRTEQSS